ncbi:MULTISPECIES: AraC family transcriptional regulator ligand-binding domain-containing protein [Vibrio]|uniref:AraC family transcriptional regulator n=1 Tax=Vibrio TaxID=662 RepID=UPI003D1036EC
MTSLNQQHFFDAILGYWENIVRSESTVAIDIANFLRKAGIIRITQGQYQPIQASQVHTLMAITVEQLHIDGLGLRIAKRLKLQDMGAWGYAMISCQNLKQLLDTGLQFSYITKDYVDIHIGYDSEYAYITADDRSHGRSAQHYTIEDAICHYYLGIERFLGQEFDRKRVHVDFAYPAPHYLPLYKTIFTTNLSFNAKKNQLRFPVEWIRSAISMNPALIAHVATLQSQTLIDDTATHPISYQIRVKLLTQLKYGLPSMEAMAIEMNTTSRTLRRKLIAEETTYKHLVLDTRMQVARDYLLNTPLSTTEIAELLSYHSSPPFFRAFQNYYGMSPHQYRIQSRHE